MLSFVDYKINDLVSGMVFITLTNTIDEKFHLDTIAIIIDAALVFDIVFTSFDADAKCICLS